MSSLAQHRRITLTIFAALALSAWIVTAKASSSIPTNRLALAVSRCFLGKYSPESCRTMRQKLAVSEAPRSYQWRALLALAEGDSLAAIHDARQAVAQTPGNSMAQGLLATVHEQTGHWSAAVVQWAALADDNPNQKAAAVYQLLRMGEQAHRENRQRDAVEALEAAWTMRPGDPEIAYYLAYASYWNGNLPRAITVLRQALDTHPHDPMSGPLRETLERYE